MCFLRNLHKHPQEKVKVLVMTKLATKKVGAAQASWGVAPTLSIIMGEPMLLVIAVMIQGL